MLKHPENSN